MNRYLVCLYKGEYIKDRFDFPNLTQARKACKHYISIGYTAAGIIDREGCGYDYIAVFGDRSVV